MVGTRTPPRQFASSFPYKYVLQSNPGTKFPFADLRGEHHFSKGECLVDLDLNQYAWREADRNEQTKPIPRNINYLDRPTLLRQRREGAQEPRIRRTKARLVSPI